MRTVRLFRVFELLQAAGPRGMTPNELISRLSDWGLPIEERQLQRDIKTLRESMGLPIAKTSDLDGRQIATGNRIAYILDRRGHIPPELVRTGKALACFESTGSRIWGQSLDEGWTLLHHVQAAGVEEVVTQLPRLFPNTRAIYLGQFQYNHFVLEVPDNLEFDLRIRIGRIERISQKPAQLERGELLIGLEGRAMLSRLFGPSRGHVKIVFERGESHVTFASLPGIEQSFGVHARSPDAAFNHTPAPFRFDFARRRVETSGLLTFGGCVAYLWLPCAGTAEASR